MRLNLMTPSGWIVDHEMYNRLFTMHGVIMVWFFLVPAIPVTLGNFVTPLMLGARDLAFPRLNLASWYLFIAGGSIALVGLAAGGVDTGWTFYTPLSTDYSKGYVVLVCCRHHPVGLFVDRDRPQFHDHHPQAAAAGHGMVPDAAVPVVALFDVGAVRAGDAGAGHGDDADHVRANLQSRRVRSPHWAAIRCCSNTCSGSTRIRPCTS